jgi:radical SAM enzyme (TIGR01210 family)
MRFVLLDVHFYPDAPGKRAEWIVRQRPQRTPLDSSRPYAYFVEDERSATGEIVPVATIFLTNRECPWRCVMCDLWKNTLLESVEPDAIPRQIQFALDRLPAARQIKLYNSGSFFDVQAIPRADYAAIAELVRPFDRVITECHPALIGDQCFGFHDLLGRPLEVAMGLETAHPGVLEKLNKRMTIDQFQTASASLRSNGIDLRVFLLVKPPFMRCEETLEWTQRSVDFAFECGATAVSLIPTRGGNGAMETLVKMGEFSPPPLASLEAAVKYGLDRSRGRVFADLWDLEQSAPRCPECWPRRLERLQKMNLTQQTTAPISCLRCGGLS